MDFLLTLLLIPFSMPLVLGFVTMCCCASNCTEMCDGGTPDEFQITISGVTNGSCSGCTAINGTWTLSATTTDCSGATIIGSTPAACYRKFDNSGGSTICSSGDGFCFYLQNNLSGSDYFTQVQAFWRTLIFDPTRGQAIAWKVTHGSTKPDCNAFGSLDVPYFSSTGTCVGTSSTCLLSAV